MKNKFSLYLSTFLTLAGAFLYSCSPYSAADQDNFSKPVTSKDNTLYFQSELSPIKTGDITNFDGPDLPEDIKPVNSDRSETFLHTWPKDRVMKDGEVFLYNNPVTHRIEFFRMKLDPGKLLQDDIPTNGKDNPSWAYLGYIGHTDAEPHLNRYYPAESPNIKDPYYLNFHTFNENGQFKKFTSGAIYIDYDKENNEVRFYRFTGLYDSRGMVLLFPNEKKYHTKDDGSWVHIDYKDPALLDYIVTLMSPEAQAKLKPVALVRVKRNDDMREVVRTYARCLNKLRRYLRDQIATQHIDVILTHSSLDLVQTFADFRTNFTDALNDLHTAAEALSLNFNLQNYRRYWMAVLVMQNLLQNVVMEAVLNGEEDYDNSQLEIDDVNQHIHDYLADLNLAFTALPSGTDDNMMMVYFNTYCATEQCMQDLLVNDSYRGGELK